MKTQNSGRRYDIDWLRVIAIGLLLIYHISISFQPWGVLIGFIQNSEAFDAVWVPMTMLNVWRIPLLFFVSGMGVYFSLQRRNLKQLIGERFRRILLPFLFGVVLIVPIHVLLWQKYYNQDFSYKIQPGHLWFLANLVIYVLVLSPIFVILIKNQEKPWASKLQRIMGKVSGLFIIAAAFVIEVLIVKPGIFELYAMTLHGFVLGMLAFFFGFLIMYSNNFYHTITKGCWFLFALAITLYSIRYVFYELRAPNYLMAIESCSWIFTVFAFAHKYLNKPGRILQYLSKGAYPIYIVHMVFLYLGGLIIFPLKLSVGVKFGFVTLFTFIGCFGMYELFVRRLRFTRPLFGLK